MKFIWSKMTKMFQRFHLEPFEETNITQQDIALLQYICFFFLSFVISTQNVVVY